MKCANCEQPIVDPDNPRCISCGELTESEESPHYSEATLEIQESLKKVSAGSLPLADAMGIFGSMMGTVQKVLDQAASDLEFSLEESPSETEGESGLDDQVMQGFGGVQTALQDSLSELGSLFGQCKTIDDFNRLLPELEGKLEFLQDGIDDLGEITDDLCVPEITEYVADPVPEEVSEAVSHLDSAVTSIVRFMDESRDRNDVVLSVVAAEKAIESLKRYLNQ